MKIKILRAVLGATLAGLTARAETATLAVDKTQSHISVAVKATMDSFQGTLSDYTLEAKVDRAAGTVEALVLRFRFTDVKTGKAARDQQMNEWQQTEKYPEAAFTLQKLAPGTGGAMEASGVLRLHGVDRPIAFPVTIKKSGEDYTIDGEAVVDTQAYGLPIIKKFALFKVDPKVHILFHLQGSAKS